MASIKADIMTALAARLEKVTSLNGYTTNVNCVYSDEIPMGIQLNSYQLPAVFLIDGPDQIEMQQGCVKGNWEVRAQLWDNRVSDSVMQQFVRDIYKAIYADDPVAQRNGEFRGLTNRVYEVQPLSISPDLNMIEANRVIELSFTIRYSTNLWDM